MTLTDKTSFLSKYRIDPTDYDNSTLQWESLCDIYKNHFENTPDLEQIALFISGCLHKMPEVHSLKTRIKEPEHLIEKIIRKKISNPELDITIENYSNIITDLIGVRVLHLFKEEWCPIHNYVMQNWNTVETPFAYIRSGDPEEFTETFISNGCEIKEHPYGYRSVHYLLKSSPTKKDSITELQIRTIFEEGWSEIDHRIRYPYDTENSILSQFLDLFNRLSGSADEMGSYIKFLKRSLDGREANFNRKLAEYKSQIDALTIDSIKKEALEKKLKELTDNISITNLSNTGFILTKSSTSFTPTIQLGTDGKIGFTSVLKTPDFIFSDKNIDLTTVVNNNFEMQPLKDNTGITFDKK